jgi:hypothetical protein
MEKARIILAIPPFEFLLRLFQWVAESARMS